MLQHLYFDPIQASWAQWNCLSKGSLLHTPLVFASLTKMSSPMESVSPQPSCDDNQAKYTPPLGNSRFYKSNQSRRIKCCCPRGCLRCSTNETKTNESPHDTSSPARGRSLTPKYDRTNGNGKQIPPDEAVLLEPPLWPPTTSSVNGQEGLATHQFERHTPIETNDLGTHAHDSIQHWLEQHHHTPTHPYGFTTSPGTSMLVETSTMAPSVASSGFLPPRAPSSADLLSFATGGFDGGGGGEVKVQTCAFTPLWLTHERRYCRGVLFEGGGEDAVGYPATIDL